MAKKKEKTLEEKLQEALVPENQWPYMLPENWCWVKLNKLYHVNPKNIVEDDSVDAAFIPMANIEPNFIGKYKFEVDSWHKVRKGHTQFADGDVTFAKISPCFENGKAFIAENLPNGIGAGTTELIVLRNRKIVPKYTFYLISTEKFVNGGRRTYSGVVGQQRISMDYVNQFPIPLPPLPEQKRIVHRIESLFAKLDEAKEKIQQVLDGAEMRKAAILHKAFTGELTKTWRREKGISDDNWVTKKLCETEIDIIDGDRGKNYPKKDEFSNDGYCVFLNAKNVTKTGFQFENIQYITQEKDELLRKGKLKRGDIVLTTRGTIGNIALYDDSIPFDNMRINSGMVIYRYGESFYGPYIIWLYRSPFIIKQYSLLQTGSAQPQLPIKDMRNLQLSIPCIEEQKCIAKLLDDFAMINVNIVEKCNKVISDIDVMKKSILAKAFRGELGTNNPTEDSALNLLKEVLQDKF